jgi:HK97 family phage prohead protease
MESPMTEYRRTDDGVETPERESRAVSGLELRAADDGNPVLTGYALVYDTRYDIGGGPDNGGFTEVIARGAATKSAKEADVKLLVNHAGVPLARTKSGTMTLESDDIGLRVSAELDPSNPVVAELRSAMERGDMDEMSFAFRALNQDWSDNYEVRTIRELKLFDVSVVTFPANPATVAQIRESALEAETATTTPSGRSLALARRQYEALSI